MYIKSPVKYTSGPVCAHVDCEYIIYFMSAIWAGTRQLFYWLSCSRLKEVRSGSSGCIFSKILEYFILDQCSHHIYSDFEFGFVQNRSTSMATSLVHDVCALLNAQGSPVYLCSLDVEGAFDSLPHSLLFDCVSGILPDISWRIFYYWYTNMRVQVKWNNRLGVP